MGLELLVPSRRHRGSLLKNGVSTEVHRKDSEKRLRPEPLVSHQHLKEG